MKKLIYKDEKINKIWVIVICFFYLPFIYFIWYFITMGVEETVNLFFAIAWFCLISIFLWSYLKDSIKLRKKFKMIKEKGVVYSAYIEGFNYEAKIEPVISSNEISSDWKIAKDFTLNVSYITEEGVKEHYVTPILGFNPITDIASRKCNIYLYKGEMYVTDFEINNDKNISLWSEDSEEVQDYLEKNKNIKKEVHSYIRFGLIILILYIIILLLFLLF